MTLPEKDCLPALGNELKRCDEDEYDCGNGQCIHGLGLCDGEYQCMNGADELEWWVPSYVRMLQEVQKVWEENRLQLSIVRFSNCIFLYYDELIYVARNQKFKIIVEQRVYVFRKRRNNRAFDVL